MKKKLVIASTLFTFLISIVTTILSVFLSNKLMYIKPKDVNVVSIREKRARRYDENWLDNCPRKELYLPSPNGYLIRGTLYQPLITTNTVIICHGVTENKINSLKFIRMYERLGYNTVVYDHRRHGESGGKTTSYGYYEKIDLQTVITEIREIIGRDAILGIHGESMGAATTLLYAGTINDDADFYISDCAFSDFKVLLRKIVKETISVNLEVAVKISNLAIRLRDGYTFNHVNPIDAVANIFKPVLFIHSIPDAFIPVTMAKDLYEAKINGARELVLFEKGEHAQSFNVSPELYEDTVRGFLDKYVRKNWLVLNELQ